MGPQSAILSGGFSPWQAPLAALFSGISAAAQPGGFANFGQGATQGIQNFQQGQQQQQMMDLRRMQIEQAQEEMRRANQEREQEQATLNLIRQRLAGAPGSPTQMQTGGPGGIQTSPEMGSFQTASGAPQAAMFADNPQQAALFQDYAQIDPMGAFQMMLKEGFAEPEKVQASSGVGKIMEDFNNGLIDEATRDALLKKETYIPPREGQGMTERQRNAVAAGLQPGTPEYQQYILGRDDTAPGVFQGTGLDAQSYNIVLEGTKSGQTNTPEYAAAFANLAMPKVSFDAVTGKSVIVQPDMSWAAKPGGAAAAGEPPSQSPQNATSMQVPGATITSDPGAPIYNETQGKAAGFADRMTDANTIFDDSSVANAGQNLAQSGLSAIPVFGNFLTSANRQKFEQAERNFINSQLRRESGAVISPEEFANARAQYIPQPGDSKEVLEQKKANRQSNIEAMRRESGPFYKPKSAPAGDNPYSNMSDEEFENFLKKRQGR